MNATTAFTESALGCFDFNGQPVRVLGTPERPLFVAKDVCRQLGLENHHKAVRGLDADEKGVTNGNPLNGRGGPQKLTVVTESGLYHLIFNSRKAEAVAFRRWVTAEVLPAIRRQGFYRTSADMTLALRGQMTAMFTRMVAEGQNFRVRVENGETAWFRIRNENGTQDHVRVPELPRLLTVAGRGRK